MEETKTNNDIVKKGSNPWVFVSIILGIAVIVLLGIIFFKGGLTGNVVLSEKDIGAKAVDFINTQVLKGGNATVTLDSVTTSGGLYEVLVNYKGKKIPTYFTKDGQYYVGNQIVPLTGQATSTNTANTQTQQTSSTPVDIPIGNSPVLGNTSAKLTIVEFSDFSCPYCGAASGLSKSIVDAMKQRDPTWEPAVPGIIKDYVNTGKAKFIYKYSMGHTGGHPASLVGFCLNDQNLFWKFHDLAFANQADVENLTKMETLAKGLGADMTKLNTCLDSKKYDSKLNDDESLGQSIGIGGTPAIYANGIKVANGAEPYSNVKKAIDSILSKVQ